MSALVAQELFGGVYYWGHALGLFNNIIHVQQWLRTANTCPVCREKVKSSPKPAPTRRRPYRDSSSPSETNHGASSSSSGNGGSPAHTNAQSNDGRPLSFAAMVFDRVMNDGRDVAAEPWSSSPPQVFLGTRDVRGVFRERLRAQQQQQRTREPPHVHELPYHLRVPPPNQSGTSSRSTTGAGMGGTDGPGARPFGFVSLLRGQGSDTSMSTSSSSNMVVDEVGTRHEASGRRSMAGTGSNGSGSLFMDAPTMQRRESIFAFVPPSSGTFNGAGGPPPPLPPPQTGFDGHGHGQPPTMVISNSTESSREWRNARGYDAVFNVEPSRSSSSASSSSSVSASQARPMNVTNRIPIDEESPFEEYMFGWHLRLGHSYPYGGSGDSANSGP